MEGDNIVIFTIAIHRSSLLPINSVFWNNRKFRLKLTLQIAAILPKYKMMLSHRQLSDVQAVLVVIISDINNIFSVEKIAYSLILLMCIMKRSDMQKCAMHAGIVKIAYINSVCCKIARERVKYM